MPTHSEQQTNGPTTSTVAHEAGSAGLQDLIRRILACSRDDQRLVAERLLRHMLGEQPSRKYCIFNADGSPFIFLTPTLGLDRRQITPELLEDYARLCTLPETYRLLSDSVARLQAMQAWQDLPDMQDAP